MVDSAALIPSDPRFTQQWGLTTINAPDAWDLETGTDAVVIGIIDSGISMAATGGLEPPRPATRAATSSAPTSSTAARRGT